MEEENFIEELDKKRKIIYFAGIGCLVLAVAIFFIFFYKAINPSEPTDVVTPKKENVAYIYNTVPQTKNDCLSMRDAAEKQECLDNIILDVAVDEDDFDGCYNIKNQESKVDCMHRVAHNLLSVDLCKKIPDKETVEVCITDVAIASRDPVICTEAYEESFERKECEDVTSAFIIAGNGKKTDLKKCEELETKEYSQLCFKMSVTAKFSGDCSQVPETYRQKCLDLSVTQAAEEPSDCDVVKDPNFKKQCLNIATLGMEEARNIDSDNDNITDGNELFMNLDPNNPDTDGDGVPDGVEWKGFGTDPGNPDTDNDGLNDFDEIKKYETNPKNPDTDADGKSDGAEIKLGTDPLKKD